MKILDHDAAHAFVEQANDNVFWDGYDMVFFNPSAAAWAHARGMFRKGKWGVAHRVSVTTNGKWYVNDKFARLSRS